MADLSSNHCAALDALKRVGSTLSDRYHITRLIGLGGMATVYAGRHRNGHPVAVKVLHERFASAELRRSVQREARLANEIGHPAVVPVIDDDVTPDGCVFLVMPLLEGETLRARAARFGGKLPTEEVVGVAHALLGALSAAHARNVVHCDIKPDNVFVMHGGAIRLLDFGIGRLFGHGQSAEATQAGRAVGTPAFMAPEQALARAHDIDGRTDLWGLGATMFSLLSGRLVHEASTAAETSALAATRPARPLGEVAPSIPGPLRDVVDRALTFAREGRWENADAMEAALVVAFERSCGKAVESLPPLAVPQETTKDGFDAAPTANATANSDAGLVQATTGAASSCVRASAAFRDARRAVWGRRIRAVSAFALVTAAAGTLAVATAMRARTETAPPTSAEGAPPAAATTPADIPAGGSRQMTRGSPLVPLPTVPPPAESPTPAPLVTLRAPPPRVTAAPKRITPQPATVASAVPTLNCDPPYTIDSAGHHVYKLECN